MQTEKSKKKRSPRKYRLLRLSILLIVLILCGVLLFPHAERALIVWLKDDPFTPFCQAEHLEVAYMTGNLETVALHRLQLDGSRPIRISDLHDPHAVQFRWTPDNRYLVYSMANASPDYLHFFDTSDESTYSIYLPDPQFSWYIMPDSSAVIVWMRYSTTTRDAKFRITLPLTDETEAEPISGIPEVLFIRNFNIQKIGGYYTIGSMRSLYYPEADQVKFAPDSDYVAMTQRTVQRAGVNKGKHIVIQKVDSDTPLWEIKNETDDYDVEYLIQDISSSDDLLYFRQYYPIGANTVAGDMPAEAFIADLETQEITPILNDRDMLDIRNLQWIPDHDLMYLALENWDTREIEVYIGEYDGSNRTLVTAMPFNNYSIGAFQITPDGQYLSYVDRYNDWLYLLDFDTRDKCRVARGRTDNWSTSYDWRLVEN